MKHMPLVEGGYTKVDDEDYDHLKEFQWHKVRIPGGHTDYAIRRIYNEDGVPSREYLHRIVMGLPKNDLREVDHQNKDGLCNTKKNLRILTTAENQQNARTRSDSTSKLRGVLWHRGAKKWRAKIDLDGKRCHLGLYKTKWEAAYARNQGSKLLHQYGNENKIPESRLPKPKKRSEIRKKVQDYLRAFQGDEETLI